MIQAQNRKTEFFIRVSKNQIIWGGNCFMLPSSYGWIVWDKMISGDVDFSHCELAWTSFDKAVKKFTYRIQNAYEKRIHPTQKPTSLYSFCLANYAKTGDKILDTHLGSGSIAIACHQLGFDLTACELDTDYFNAAIERIKQKTTQTNLF